MALKVYSSFIDDRCPGLVIIWHVGSSRIQLCRMGGPQGSYVLDTRRHHTYKESAGAFAGAEKWFKVLANIYEARPADETPDVRQKVVVKD